MPEITHKNVSTHAQSLASGQVLAPGETALLGDDPHDRALAEQGSLIPVDPAPKKTTKET